MSDALTSGNFVNATAPIVRYPPEFFAFGAAGFRHVSALLNDLALAASSIQATPPPDPPAKRRRSAPAPYSATKDSRGYNIWRAVMDGIPSPSKERITATYPGCCDGIRAGDWSTRRKHQFSASHARHLEDEDLQYIPIGLCPACPEDLGCRDEGQRVDIYAQKRRHFGTCAAYRALCERTNTKPEPIPTNRAAVKALLNERDRLRAALGFMTPKNVPATFPITPLPLLTPVAPALPSDGACVPNPVEQQYDSPSGSTSTPSLTLSPSSSTACSRVITPTEQIDPQNTYSFSLMPNPSPAPVHETCGSHGTMNLDTPFPAYLSPNHPSVSELNSMPNIATSMRPDVSLSANEFSAISNPLDVNPAQGSKQIIDYGALAHLGTDTSEYLNLHADIFQERFPVDDEQFVQVNGGYGGGPFLSPGEGFLDLLQSGSFPVHPVQQRVPGMTPVV